MSTIDPFTARRKKKPKVLVLYNRPEAPEGEPAASDERHLDAPVLHLQRLEDVVAVVEGLREGGFEVAHHNVDDDPDRVMWGVVVERPDIIYNLIDSMEGDYTHHATVTGYYWLLGMPYTGAEPFVLTLCQDRARAHVLLDDAGIPVPGFIVVRDVNAVPETEDLDYPLVVTQSFDDIYYDEGLDRPLYSRDELQARVAELAREFELPLLVEEYIDGRRLHAVIIGNKGLEVLPITETVVPTDEEIDEWEEQQAEAAADPDGDPEDDAHPHEPDAPEPVVMWHERIILAQLDQDTADHVRTLARRAFRVMGCRDCAQIDFHLDDAGVPHVVDVRPSFDHLPGSPFQIAADSSDRGYGGIVAEITRIACRRARILDGDPESEAPPPPEPEPDHLAVDEADEPEDAEELAEDHAEDHGEDQEEDQTEETDSGSEEDKAS